MSNPPSLMRGADLAEGTAKGVSPWPDATKKIILLRRGGRVFAWLDACPHYRGGAPMAWKRDAYLDAAGDHIVCFSHGALFDPESGDCVAGPCLGKRLRRIAVEEGADGEIRLTQGLGGLRAQ